MKRCPYSSSRYTGVENISIGYCAKSGRLYHTWTVKLQLPYNTKQQALNVGQG